MIKIRAKSATALRREAIVSAAEQSWLHNDSRVIARQRDVLQFELAATEEHITGLQASLVAVRAKEARLRAQVEGLTRVLSRR